MDNALAALDVARRARSQGDYAKAVRFCEKSLRIKPTTAGETLLAQVKREQANPPDSPPSSSSSSSYTSSSSSSSSHSRPRAPKRAQSAPPEHKNYTPEQEALAKKINKMKDFYQILGLDKTKATERDISRAYKKLALKLHPDKNRAPSAEEAFKKLSNAFSVLNDKEKKEHYDRWGHEDDTPSGGGGGFRRRGRGGQQFYYQEEMSPEDIFNFMFGGGHTFQTRRRHRHQQSDGQGGGQRQQNGAQLQIIFALAMLFLFSFLNAPAQESTPFSLEKTGTFKIKRTTQSGVPYYVSKSFVHMYRDKRSLNTIETMVEKKKIRELEDLCRLDKQKKKKEIAAARRKKGLEMTKAMDRAQKLKTPRCTELEDLKAGFYV